MGANVLDRHTDVLRLGGHVGHRVPQGVGPVGVDDIHRIDAVALGLAHGLAAAVEDLGVDVNVIERNFRPRAYNPNMTIRATQLVMMSLEVHSTEPG